MAEVLFDGLVAAIGWFFYVCYWGARKEVRRVGYVLLTGTLWVSSLWIFSQKLHLLWIYRNTSGPFFDTMIRSLDAISVRYHILFGMALSVLIPLFIYGFPVWSRIRKYQKGLDEIGLKTSGGQKPKVIDYFTRDTEEIVLVKARGIGAKRFQDKIQDISSAIGQVVLEIRQSKEKVSDVELLLKVKEIPLGCHFNDFREDLTEPYTFPVGHTKDGRIVQDIRELPHMMVAGSTGGGKSVFLNNVLLGLLNSTPNIKVYLLDLKYGVEAAPYRRLPNVEIAKDEAESVEILEKVQAEMEERMKGMNDREIQTLDLEEAGKEAIVVCIDEASVLFGKGRTSSELKGMIDRARELSDRIAKQARACGIHMVLATQKVTTDAIDSRVQGNLSGRMCFRTATLAGSVTVLGTKVAKELPRIKGRAYWMNGVDVIQVQAPYISSEEVKEEIKKLSEKFKNEETSEEANVTPKNAAAILGSRDDTDE